MIRLMTNTRRTKPALSASSLRKLIDFNDLRALHSGNHHLGHPHARLNQERCSAEVDQRHHHLSSVVGVDRARRIGHRDSELGCEPRPRSNLRLETRRQRHGEPAPNHRNVTRLHQQRRVDVRRQVHPRRQLRLVDRKDRARAQPLELNLDGVHGRRVTRHTRVRQSPSPQPQLRLHDRQH